MGAYGGIGRMDLGECVGFGVLDGLDGLKVLSGARAYMRTCPYGIPAVLGTHGSPWMPMDQGAQAKGAPSELGSAFYPSAMEKGDLMASLRSG